MHKTVLASSLLLIAGCNLAPEKTYSSDIGVTPVPLEEGQLAGTWVGQLQFATLYDTGIVGERNAGANGGRIIKFTWDGSAKTYSADLRWCWDEVFEVEGQRNSFDEATLHALRPVILTGRVDHAGGIVDTDRIADLWGLQNMPDPFTTPLPTPQNFRDEPQASWMLDEDGDGNPGVTVHMSGVATGDGYIINRSIWKLHGVAKSTDELVGLINSEAVQQNLLDSTITLGGMRYSGETKQRPDPDPKASWFQMLRVADEATCEDAKAARDDGRLSRRRPF